MGEETNIDDLFAEDAKPKRKPRAAAKPKVVVEQMTDDELAAVVAGDPRKGVRSAAEAEVARRASPEVVQATGETELIDNAVRIRRLDWECVCGNTNTLDLQLCGKCREPRYTAN